MRRRLLPLAAVLLGASAAGCSNADPVAERLSLAFLPSSADDQDRGGAGADTGEHLDAGGEVLLEAAVTVRHDQVDEGNPYIERRLNDRAEALMTGHDVWHIRFDRLHEPLADGAEWQRDEGKLIHYSRWALVGTPDTALRDFFADTPIRPFFSAWTRETGRGDGREPPALTVSLEFVFDGGARATAGEAHKVERGLRVFAADVARYHRRVAALWRHMDKHPDRRFDCLLALLRAARGDELPEPVRGRRPLELAPNTTPPEPLERQRKQPALRDLEIELIERIVESGEPLMEILEVPEDDAFTLRELSRRVFDPFPGAVTVVPDGPVVEAVGFTESGEGWTIPALDLWRAFEGIEARFVSPDPLLFLLETDHEDFGCDRHDSACRDRERVLAFIERGAFRARSGSSTLVRQALEAALRPRDVYRLTWIRGGPEDSPSSETAADNDSVSGPSAGRRRPQAAGRGGV